VSLNLLESSGPVQVCNGIALLLLTLPEDGSRLLPKHIGVFCIRKLVPFVGDEAVYVCQLHRRCTVLRIYVVVIRPCYTPTALFSKGIPVSACMMVIFVSYLSIKIKKSVSIT
jgi:hypothetical protein